MRADARALEAESPPELQCTVPWVYFAWYLFSHPGGYLPFHPEHVAHVRGGRPTRASNPPKQCLIVPRFWDNWSQPKTSVSIKTEFGWINVDWRVAQPFLLFKYQGIGYVYYWVWLVLGTTCRLLSAVYWVLLSTTVYFSNLQVIIAPDMSSSA